MSAITVQHGIPQKDGSYKNETVAKLSDAQQNDSIFIEPADFFNQSFKAQVDSILEPKGLKVVWERAKQTKFGNYRAFIGDKDYTRPTTELA